MSNPNIVFIDSAVTDYESLIAGIQTGTSVVILDSTKDGVEQITQALEGGQYQSVQIISHGSAGSLQLGTTQLNVNNLNSYTNQLQKWKNYLTDNADILLYACDVASIDLAFVQQLSQITGADVAASDDITGSAELGGDWDLEVKVGEIESDLALTPQTTKTYRSILPILFAPATNISLGKNINSVAVGDFNKDGKLDLAVANFDSNNVSVLLGNGDGTFGAATNFNVENSPIYLTVGDFNRDDYSDLVVVNSASNTISVLLAQANGTFNTTRYNVGTNPMSVAVGDLNNNGISDLVVANYGSKNVSVLLGNNNGTFGTATNVNLQTVPIHVTLGKFNNDNNLDLVVINPDTNNVSILLGNGSGGFGTATNFAVGNAPTFAVVGDFNKDGNLDLALVNSESKNISILLGNGNGGFGTATNFEVGRSPSSATVGDFNKDGNLDLAVANDESNNVSVLLGDGTGSFTLASTHDVGTNAMSVAVGDFDKDSNLDLVVANYGSKNVSVLLNSSNLDPVLPKVSFGKANYYTAEGSSDTQITIDIKLDNPPDTDITVPIVINDRSTATNGSDYTISTLSVTFTAGSTGSNLTKQITFTVKSDSSPENNETVVLNFGTLTGVVAGTIAETTVEIADRIVSGAIFINEILFDPPSTDGPKEYIELRGTPGMAIAPGTYLVAIEGDYATNPGAVQDIFDLSGKQFGSNGLLVLLQKGSTYTANSGANVIINTGSGSGWGSGTSSSLGHIGASDIENGSVSFLLIQAATAPTLKTDIDLNNDGIADGLEYSNWNVVDSVGVLDGTSAIDKAYSKIVFRKDSIGSVPTDATVVDVSFIAGYVGRTGNTTGSTASDWVASLPSGNAPNVILGTSTDTSVADLADQPLNHIGNTNFAPIDVNYVISTATPTATEGNSGTQTVTFTITRSGDTSVATSVNYFFDGTATFSSDYKDIKVAGTTSGASGTVVFGAGETTKNITLNVVGETVDEVDETINLNLSYLRQTVAIAPGTITIIDDDNPPAISFSPVSTSGSENSGNLVLTVKLSSVSGKTITVDYSTANDSAIAGVDYTAVSGTLTFNPGELTQTITVPILDDLAFESNERFFVNLSNPTNATIAATNNQGIGTINDDDPTVFFSPTSTSGSENNGNLVFTVRLSKASSQPIQVNYSTANDTAIAGVDYTPVSGTLTFDPGVTTQTITVPILDDLLADSGERFFVNLTPVTSVIISNNQATGTITDDDPTVSFLSTNVSGSENTGNIVFTVRLSRASSQPIQVNYNTSDDTAIAGIDYTAVSGTLTFDPGVTIQTITVPILDDLLADSGERFFINLSNPNLTFTNNQATGTITDDDPTVSFSSTSVSGSENVGNLVFTVRLSRSSTQTITVNYSTSDNTAIAGEDYTAVSGTLTFNPGETSKTIEVPILNDIFVESSENFFVNLSNPNLTFTNNQATGTINVDNNDKRNIIVSPTTHGLVTTEAGGTANFSIQLTEQPTADVTINLSSSNVNEGTISVSSVTFTPANWKTPQIVTVTGVNDGIADDNITYKITTDTIVSNDSNYSNFNVANIAVIDVVNIKSGNQVNSIITGSANNDTLQGTSSDDLIFGFAGNDVIVGNEGNDYLYGGIGNDNLTGGEGNDYLYGGDGNDTLTGGNGSDYLYGDAGNDNITGGEEDDYLYGGDGNDILTGDNGSDYLFGDVGNDNLIGGQGNDYLYGSIGNDTLTGSEGNDYLYGGDGNDSLIGGEGNDHLYGGTGNDILTGGAGNDIFVLAIGEGRDTIQDFNISEDLIALSGGLTYSGLSITQSGSNTLIRITANSENLAQLNGITASTLNASHFITF